MSYGLSAAGYDFRVKFDPNLLNHNGEVCLCAGGFMLATTVERFAFPSDVIGFVKDKSSWARQGLALQNTVIEPGWEGYVTLELTNHSRDTIWMFDEQPIGQMIFQMLDFPTEMPYSGKYQNQEQKAVPAKMEGA
jgi:dCTP deaminase